MAEQIRPSETVKKAFNEARNSRLKAHAPYSKFQVGAALIADNGSIYGGCNIENASYGATVCAERVAIWKAVSQGVSQVTDIVVVTDAEHPAFPCALCLQVMAEFLAPESRVWIGNLQGILSSHTFESLLPRPFGPRELKEASE